MPGRKIGQADDRGQPPISDEELSVRAAEHYGLSADEEKTLRVILGCLVLQRRQGDLQDAVSCADLARLVGIDALAHTLARMAWNMPDLEGFLERIAGVAEGADAARVRSVLAVCAESRGDIAAMERLLRSALEADPTFDLALMGVASRETISGRYAEALDHLRDAGVPPDDFERAWLEAIVRPAFPATGRNDPCPCGSGRKYKHCHLGRSGDVVAPDAHRALRHKLDLWMTRPDAGRVMNAIYADISASAGRNRGKRRPAGSAVAAALDPELLETLAPVLLPDIALFDRGELERFIGVEGPHLPAAEATLVESWIETKRTLVEVVSVRRGKGLTVRDMLASDVGPIDLADVSLSMGVASLDLLCLRLTPDGHGAVYPSDALSIPRSRRTQAAEVIHSGDGVALARWIAMPVAPPVMQNTEGEPLALIKATYRLPDPADAAAALGRRLRDEGEGRFVELHEGRGREWIRGSISIDGDVATIDTNSVKRAARLERTLLRAAPGARLIKREESGIEELLAEPGAGQRPGEFGPDEESLAHSPEVAAAMAEAMREYERQWIDESIPALGGLTPRQAAADTAMRHELDALLKDLEWSNRRAGPGPANRGAMDAARLRALLGM